MPIYERTPDNKSKNPYSLTRKNINKSLLKNQLRNSNGSNGKDVINREMLSDTIKSDEFLQNKLYTNTYQNLQNESIGQSSGDGYGAIHHENFVKTANSFYQ